MNQKIVLQDREGNSSKIFVPTAKFNEIYDILSINPYQIITLIKQNSHEIEGQQGSYSLNDRASLPENLKVVLDSQSFAEDNKYTSANLDELSTRLLSQQHQLVGILMSLVTLETSVKRGYMINLDQANKKSEFQADQIKMVLAVISSILKD